MVAARTGLVNAGSAPLRCRQARPSFQERRNGGQNLLHLTEYPSVTQLLRQGVDDALIARLDPPAPAWPSRTASSGVA
ncbi:MAG TPA: hypothetical protein VMM92_13745, partial [Thermoanaerobaculia bacterium]|nr:hypothetical protein [Thermoanaerobaculia bacterium]